MATSTGLGFILLLTIEYALSGQPSILSSLYKKAAQENRPMILVVDSVANKDADYSPMNSNTQNKYDLDAKKQFKYKENALKPWPMSVLQRLAPQHYHIDNQHNHALDHTRQPFKQKLRNRSRSRLQLYSDRDNRISSDRGVKDRRDVDRDDRDERSQNRNNRDGRIYNRDDRDRHGRDRNVRDRRYRDSSYRYDRDRRDRDYRDRRDRDRYDSDRRDRYRDDSDRRDRDRDDSDRRDRDRDDSDRRDRDRDYSDRPDRDRDDEDRRNRDRYGSDKHEQERDDNYWHDRSKDNSDKSIDRTLRALIKKTLDKAPRDKEDDDSTTLALRSSVISNLLRVANDLNCQAKDECEDKCYEKKKDNCEDKCEQKFECDEKKNKKDDCWGGGDGCDEDDECPIDNDDCGTENNNPSTRGIKYEDEEKNCKEMEC